MSLGVIAVRFFGWLFVLAAGVAIAQHFGVLAAVAPYATFYVLVRFAIWMLRLLPGDDGNDRIHQPSRTPEATPVQQHKTRPRWRLLLDVGLSVILAVVILHAILASQAPDPTREFLRWTETFNQRAQVAVDSDHYRLALATAAALSTDQEAAIRRRIANRIAQRVVIAINAHDLQRARSLLHQADSYTNTPLLTRARWSYRAAKRRAGDPSIGASAP